jgi:hypothetical protein
VLRRLGTPPFRRCREQGPVAAGALDDPQGTEVAARAACGPGDRTVPAGVGIREGLGAQILAAGSDNGIGMCAGVGVHADDERVGACDSGHRDRGSFLTNGQMLQAARCGRTPARVKVTPRHSCDEPQS